MLYPCIICLLLAYGSGAEPKMPTYKAYEIKGVLRNPAAGSARPFHDFCAEGGVPRRLSSFYGMQTEVWRRNPIKDNYTYLYESYNLVSKDDDLNKRACFVKGQHEPDSSPFLLPIPEWTEYYKYCCVDTIDFGKGPEKFNKFVTKDEDGHVFESFWTSLEGDKPVRWQQGGSSESVVIDYYYYKGTAPSDKKIIGRFDGKNCTHIEYMQFNNVDEFEAEEEVTPSIDRQFEDFKRKFAKSYTDEEAEKLHKQIFAKNLRLIEETNRAGKSYKLGINKFSDMTDEQMFRYKGRLPPRKNAKKLKQSTPEEVYGEWINKTLPDHWDWRLHGVVTPVKSQGICGSCWSFGATGAMEGALALQRKGKPVLSLSQQELVDCSWGEGNIGCMGGFGYDAFKYAKKYGLATESDYGHYMGINGKCRRKKVKPTIRVKNHKPVPAKDPEALKRALLNKGPISVSIRTGGEGFDQYLSGVFHGNCTGQVNHEVLVVGFGKQDGMEYFTIKNSWGADWGMDGYILLSAKLDTCSFEDEPYWVDVEPYNEQR